MKNKTQESLTTAINVYLVLLLFALPLYMQDGYVMIGDAKYNFFRNVTLFFLIVTAGMLLAGMLGKGEKKRICPVLSPTDIAALCFAAASGLSFCFSVDRSVALWGFFDWHMGAFSQLLFLWIYFAVSRWYDGSRYVMLAFLAGAVAVMGLGVLNKYNFDPLRLFVDLGHWNMGHLLSTIGNQNWYCGYVSVACSVCMAYACTQRGWKQALGLLGSLLAGWTILTQGSEGGYLILLAVAAVLFFRALEDREKLLSFLAVACTMPLAALVGKFCIRFRGLVLVEDGPLQGMLFWKGWPWLLLLFAGLWVCFFIRGKKGCEDRLSDGKIRKWALRIAGGMALLGFLILVGCQISDKLWQLLGQKELLRIDDNWGNGRGALWRMGLGSYFKGGVGVMLFGVGPDCFSYAIYAYYPVREIISMSGQWEDAVFANVHNEWLNMLVNEGILGFLSYIGIFATLFIRLWRAPRKNGFDLLGMLAIAGYFSYGMVSFQQVTSTPLIFAVLGMAEAKLRAERAQRPG